MTNGASAQRLVLVANDHEWTARSVETILNAVGYRVERAFTAGQTLERAAMVPPDACILDVQLPDSDGMTLCHRLRDLLGQTVPIFLATAGPTGRKERLAAYEAGAWEFFGHPLDGEALLLKLRTYLDAVSVVDELRRDSLLDEATGLYSRRGLVRRGREVLSEAVRRRRGVACVVLRPDAPELETALGSAAKLAQLAGEVLRAGGRAADAIGRLGPLDFGLIASGVGESGARQLIRRLNVLAAARPSDQFGFRAAFRAIENVTIDVDAELLLQETADAISAGNDPAGAANVA